jgi:hypothetical protein
MLKGESCWKITYGTDTDLENRTFDAHTSVEAKGGLTSISKIHLLFK